MKLNKNTLRVQEAIFAAGCDFEVLELNASTRTAEDAAKTIGCAVGQIVKSLIFKGKSSGHPILLLVSGDNRVNEKLVGRSIGEKLSKADADFAKTVTGFTIGGIPPLGHNEKILTYIDEDLLKHHVIWAAAGMPNSVFSMEAQKLETLTAGQLIAVK